MAKGKRKQRRHGSGPGSRDRLGNGRAVGGGFDARALSDVIDRAAGACLLQSQAGPAGELVAALARGPAHPEGPALVDRALGKALVDAISAAWSRGWQPADLHRVVQRAHGRQHGRLTASAMGREALRYADDTVPARWRLQLDAVGADAPAGDRWAVAVASDGDDLAAGGVPSIGRRVESVRVAVETLSLVRRLPRLPKLAPVPGESTGSPPGRRPAGATSADPRILHRVTALLAKAESTTFPDEAEALSAKAQELMTRHAIDMAVVEAERGGGPRVAGRRIGIDDPYARARVTLLGEVASANRCRAVWSKELGFATVFGDEGDLDAVEMLYTSLLVQATRAMVTQRPARPRAGAASAGATRSFRQSFLLAYAHRIGERLRHAAEAAAAGAAATGGPGAHDAGDKADGDTLLPVLARRARAAEDAAARAFPKVKTFSATARDGGGWMAGRQAADRAQLGGTSELGRRAASSPRSLGPG